MPPGRLPPPAASATIRGSPATPGTKLFRGRSHHGERTGRRNFHHELLDLYDDDRARPRGPPRLHLSRPLPSPCRGHRRSAPPPLSTTVVTNPEARPPPLVVASPRERLMGPSPLRPIQDLARPPAAGSTAAAPAADGPPGTVTAISSGSSPDFFRRPVGQPPHRRQDGMGQQRQGDMPVPARPAPHLVVGQPDLLLGRLEAALHRPAGPGRLGQPGQRRAGRAGRQVVRQLLAAHPGPCGPAASAATSGPGRD